MPTTPLKNRYGWAGPDEAKRAWNVIGHRFPAFFIAAQSRATDGRKMLLWEFTKKVNNGKHLPTFEQEIGDCVSHGSANAVNYLACMEIIRLGDRERFRPAFQPYLYGISRVQVGGGRLGSSDGSLGIWAADGVRQYGVLAADEDGVPPYSGRVAGEWGKGKGPPKKFIKLAKPYCLKSTANVRTYAQVRDAIVNGYPVTVASMRGFRMQPKMDRGKHWGVPAGRWAHQMCFIGVDDDPKRPGCYMINSWGPDAHGKPAGNEPPGGFWVDAQVVEAMVAVGDSFAYSQFDGFPEQSLNWRVI